MPGGVTPGSEAVARPRWRPKPYGLDFADGAKLEIDAPTDENVVVVGLTAAIVAVEGMTPCVLVVEPLAAAKEKSPSLPSGPFDPHAHRTLESGLRQWVEEQTFLTLGYVEQLYTFGDAGVTMRRCGHSSLVTSR